MRQDLSIGFDISGLYPWKAGVSTYAGQLLAQLQQSPDIADVVLFDAMGRGGVSAAGESVTGPTVRSWPLLSGPGSFESRFGRSRARIDSFVLSPVRQVTDAFPPFAARRIAGGPPVDLYHWTGEAFIRVPDVPHVVTIHDTVPLLGRRWHNRGDTLNHVLRIRLAARYADRIIVDAESTRRDLVRLLDVPPDRIDVIPLAADPALAPASPADVARVSAAYGLVPGRYFLFIGTIEPRKNLVRVASAFDAVMRRHPERIEKLVFAGQRGWLTGEIDRGLADLGLGARLVMPGRVPEEDLAPLLTGARAVVYASLYEGFGLPPLEAMACGTPVITSNTSSLPEVVGAAGILIDPEDTGAIAGAMERLLLDDTLRAELAGRSLQRAAEFSWKRTAQLTIESYRRAIRQRKRPIF